MKISEKILIKYLITNGMSFDYVKVHCNTPGTRVGKDDHYQLLVLNRSKNIRNILQISLLLLVQAYVLTIVNTEFRSAMLGERGKYLNENCLPMVSFK